MRWAQCIDSVDVLKWLRGYATILICSCRPDAALPPKAEVLELSQAGANQKPGGLLAVRLARLIKMVAGYATILICRCGPLGMADLYSGGPGFDPRRTHR